MGKRWKHHTEGPGARHIWPLDDLRVHDLDDGPCWCLPVWEVCLDFAGEPVLIVTHNSLDEREYLERKVAGSWVARVRARFDKWRNRGLQ